MYSHFIKGSMIGQLLTRRLGRAITGIPGFLIDLVFAAFAGNENYLEYWENNSCPYADRTRQAGIFQGIFGWIGDIAGAVVGWLVGALLGTVLYLPDGVLRALAWAYDQIKEGLDAFAKFMGRTEWGFANPQSFLTKAINISMGTLGVVVAAVPWLLARAVEFILPIDHHDGSNNIALFCAGAVSVVVGTVVAIGLFPVKHLCDKAVALFRGFRDGVQSFAAFVYAKTNWEPQYDDQSCCPAVSADAIHSQVFRQKVVSYKARSTAQILFGLEEAQPALAAGQLVVYPYQENQPEIPVRQVQPPVQTDGNRPVSGSGVEKGSQSQSQQPVLPSSSILSGISDGRDGTHRYLGTSEDGEELQPGAGGKGSSYEGVSSASVLPAYNSYPSFKGV